MKKYQWNIRDDRIGFFKFIYSQYHKIEWTMYVYEQTGNVFRDYNQAALYLSGKKIKKLFEIYLLTLPKELEEKICLMIRRKISKQEEKKTS